MNDLAAPISFFQNNFQKKWKREWLPLLFLFFVFRTFATYIGYETASGPIFEPVSHRPVNIAADSLLYTDSFSQHYINVWKRWDTGWYLKIAAFGYVAEDGTTAYMPLYPWLTGVLGQLTGNFLLSALLVSNFSALLFFILFYEAGRHEGLTSQEAGLAVLSLAVFPTAFFLIAAYTESLFLVFVLGAWLSARQGRWYLAGFLSALAALTRLQGVLLTPVLMLLWLREEVKPNSWKHFFSSFQQPVWLALLLPGFVFLGWNLALTTLGFGNTTTMLETHWGIRTVLPWVGFDLFIQRLFNTPRIFVDYVDLALLVLMVLLLFYGFRKLDPALLFYCGLTLALFFMRGTPLYLLDSYSRYMLALFPVFWVMPKLPRWVLVPLLSLSLLLQLFLLMGFLDWRWVA